MDKFQAIRNEGRLLYEYIRGSKLYRLDTPTSDTDTSGVFVTPNESLFGFLGYEPQVSDDKHDNTWFEVGELCRLLMKSNPTVLESLFVPTDKIIGDVNPCFMPFLENRQMFISKQCFNPFFGYAKSQIEKARGLNKKIVNPISEKLSPFDFIYTFKSQGSVRFGKWLEARHLKQEYCGLVNIPNMHDIYGVYYDFGQHVASEEDWKNIIPFAKNYFNVTREEVKRILLEMSENPIGYRGVIKEDTKYGDIRLSSIEDKDDKPICHISYNQSGYSTHCRQYKEYQEWINERNQARYESNLDKTYDSKNMMHCFRMIHMAQEIARSGELILDREVAGDRDFLLKVRNHEFEYDEVISMLEEEKRIMNRAMEESTIKEHVDIQAVNQMLIDLRKNFWK